MGFKVQNGQAPCRKPHLRSTESCGPSQKKNKQQLSLQLRITSFQFIVTVTTRFLLKNQLLTVIN